LDIGLISFLGSVAFISLSGVMMPGPVFAVTVAKGQHQAHAGAVIGLGHGIIELPLVVLIYLGLGHVFKADGWKIAVGFLGGAVLVLIGMDMIRKRGELSSSEKDLPYGSLAAGLMTTVANPYFFIWWATIGAALVLKASAWGLVGLASFFFVHWLCDFGWSLLVSAASFKTGRLWSRKVHRIVFGGCGILLVLFGAIFIFDALPLHFDIF
jgi:threonine/homoserine/homoserine lactone efflux protein